MTEPEPQAAHSDIHDRVARGFGWIVSSQLALQGIRTIGAIIVARLLTPDDYGLAVLALVFSSLVLVFSDLALGAALVQRPVLTEADKSTAFWITISSGLLFMVLGVALSGLVAALYRQPDVQPLLAVLSLSFLLAALGSTQQSLLLRAMEFRRLELFTVVGGLLGTVGAVVLAVAGAGPWAIIGQQLVTAGATSALMWRASSWRPKWLFSRASARDLGGFSSYLVGHRLLFYVHQNADNLLIGRFLGATALGAYAIAYNVMLQPASRIAGPVQRVLSPAFARMQDEPQRIAAAWARATRLVGAISIPALAGIVVVAPFFVPVVLGDQWDAAIPVIQILAWVGMLQSVQAVNVDILIARDRPATLFRYMIAFCCIHLIAFVIGLQWGIVGVAAAYAVSSTLIEPVLTVLTGRALHVSPLIFVRSLFGVAQAVAVMVVALLWARSGLVAAGASPALCLVALIVLGALVYLPMCAWRAPEVLRDLRSLMGRARKPRLGGPPAAVTPGEV